MAQVMNPYSFFHDSKKLRSGLALALLIGALGGTAYAQHLPRGFGIIGIESCPEFVSYEIFDPAPGGNGNGFAEPGEVVDIKVSLENISSTAHLTNLSATVQIMSSPVIIVDDRLSFGTIIREQTKESIDYFTIAIPESASCGDTLYFDLTPESSELTTCFSQGFSFQLGFPSETVLFSEDFESTGSTFDYEGLWHQAFNHPCPPTLGRLSSISGSGVAAMNVFDSDGMVETCTYQNGEAVLATMTMNSPVNIPSGPGNYLLEFWEMSAVEAGTGFDYLSVEAATDGSTFSQIALFGGNSDWEQRQVSLNSFIGSDVTIRFIFNSIDSTANDQIGWYLDDLRIVDSSSGCVPHVISQPILKTFYQPDFSGASLGTAVVGVPFIDGNFAGSSAFRMTFDPAVMTIVSENNLDHAVGPPTSVDLSPLRSLNYTTSDLGTPVPLPNISIHNLDIVDRTGLPTDLILGPDPNQAGSVAVDSFFGSPLPALFDSRQTIGIGFPDLLFGDYNDDGTVSAIDFNLLLQTALGAISSDDYNVQLGDVNQNAEIDLHDAAVLLKYLDGASTTVLTLPPLPFFNSTMDITGTLESGDVLPGDTFVIGYRISNNPEEIFPDYFSFQIDYDSSQITLNQVTSGDMGPVYFHDTGSEIILSSMPQASPGGTQFPELVFLEFSVNEENSQYPIELYTDSFIDSPVLVAGDCEQDLPYYIEQGDLSGLAPPFGDINSDGVIDDDDVEIAFAVAMGLRNMDDLSFLLGNVFSGDSEITEFDAALINYLVRFFELSLPIDSLRPPSEFFGEILFGASVSEGVVFQGQVFTTQHFVENNSIFDTSFGAKKSLDGERGKGDTPTGRGTPGESLDYASFEIQYPSDKVEFVSIAPGTMGRLATKVTSDTVCISTYSDTTWETLPSFANVTWRVLDDAILPVDFIVKAKATTPTIVGQYFNSEFPVSFNNSFVTNLNDVLVLGDVDNSGDVTMADAEVLTEYIFGNVGPEGLNLLAGEVTEDSELDLRDALVIAERARSGTDFPLPNSVPSDTPFNTITLESLRFFGDASPNTVFEIGLTALPSINDGFGSGVFEMTYPESLDLLSINPEPGIELVPASSGPGKVKVVVLQGPVDGIIATFVFSVPFNQVYPIDIKFDEIGAVEYPAAIASSFEELLDVVYDNSATIGIFPPSLIPCPTGTPFIPTATPVPTPTAVPSPTPVIDDRATVFNVEGSPTEITAFHTLPAEDGLRYFIGFWSRDLTVGESWTYHGITEFFDRTSGGGTLGNGSTSIAMDLTSGGAYEIAAQIYQQGSGFIGDQIVSVYSELMGEEMPTIDFITYDEFSGGVVVDFADIAIRPGSVGFWTREIKSQDTEIIKPSPQDPQAPWIYRGVFPYPLDQGNMFIPFDPTSEATITGEFEVAAAVYEPGVGFKLPYAHNFAADDLTVYPRISGMVMEPEKGNVKVLFGGVGNEECLVGIWYRAYDPEFCLPLCDWSFLGYAEYNLLSREVNHPFFVPDPTNPNIVYEGSARLYKDLEPDFKGWFSDYHIINILCEPEFEFSK